MLLNYNNSCDKNRTASFLCPHTWLFSVYIRLSKQKAEKQKRVPCVRYIRSVFHRMIFELMLGDLFVESDLMQKCF